MRRAVRILALEMFARIVVRSPVDTGRFRGNWMLGVAVIPTGADGGADPSGNATIAEQSVGLAGFRIGQTIHFRNNLPYAAALEFGHSKQAPAGMVRLTLQEFGAISSAAAVKARVGGSER